MKTLSFGGFEPEFTEALTHSAVERGITVCETGKADIHLHINPDFRTQSVNPRTVVAVIAEPKIVRPDLYRTKVLHKYLDWVTISKQRANTLGVSKFLELPIKPPVTLQSEPVRDRRACLVAGHKFSASKLSNYGFRRRVLQSNLGNSIDLYGPDWFDPIWLELQRRFYSARMQSKYPKEFSLSELIGEFGKPYRNYRGIMDAEFKGMSKYDLSLVIENQSDYISEKIWISMARGAVPIYVGPPLSEVNQELANCVFQVKPTIEAIRNVLDGVSTVEIEQKRLAGWKFLGSDWITSRNTINTAKNFIQYIEKNYV
jgi:hypothetical protein